MNQLKNRFLSPPLGVGGLLLLLSLNLSAQTFYVSTSGNDNNTGSIEKPFATLEKARDAVKSVNHASQTATVFVRGGVYSLNHP